MKSEALAPRPLDQAFWIKIGAAVLLLLLAFYGWIGDTPGHPIYSVALAVIAFAGAARTVAEYTAEGLYRDAYLLLFGVVIGILVTPLLLRWLVV